ncbi:MAG: hypothetical protein HOQ13_00435, partial [Dermatophilaceae bacterium]|nr:hypothetical protein [Dermatophilaceae bacterium]
TVSWNEVSADKTTEPEHPAPVLQLTPESGPTATSTPGGTAGAVPPVAAATTREATGTDSAGTVSLALSGAALVVSLLAAVTAWRRGRPAAADAAPVTADAAPVTADAAPVTADGTTAGDTAVRAPEDARP